MAADEPDWRASPTTKIRFIEKIHHVADNVPRKNFSK